MCVVYECVYRNKPQTRKNNNNKTHISHVELHGIRRYACYFLCDAHTNLCKICDVDEIEQIFTAWRKCSLWCFFLIEVKLLFCFTFYFFMGLNYYLYKLFFFLIYKNMNDFPKLGDFYLYGILRIRCQRLGPIFNWPC